MRYSTEQIEIGVFLFLNRDMLMNTLKIEYTQHLACRDAYDSGLFLATYDDMLKEEMKKFMIRFIGSTFNHDIESSYVLCEGKYLNKQIDNIIRRSIYE
jgi:hypothetical protein